MYKRLLNNHLKGSQSFFLFGPRGVGKTSWVKLSLPDSLYIDLLKGDIYLELSSRPEQLENHIPPNFKEWIIIDEVQRIPELLNEVHRLIENKHYKFILTGSSARSLKRKGVNLLAGRALAFKMFPLTALELGDDFNLDSSLKFGHLPYIFSKKTEQDIEAYLDSYTQTYLKEEILQEGLTRNVGAFSRFLQTASFSQGSLINMSDIGREAGIHRKVVEDYFQILEDLLLAQKVPIFTKRAKRKTVSHPKFYFFDVGVYRAIRPKGPYDTVEEIEGCAYESLVYQEIQAINHYFNFKYEIFFWRTVDQVEVDFILYGPKGIIAIEVKRTKNISLSTLKGLKTFYKDYPEADLYLFYGGDRLYFDDNIKIIPLTQALLSLKDILERSNSYKDSKPL